MILTATQIENAVSRNEVIIHPFRRSQLAPNSYDFRLGNRCCVYKRSVLDALKDNPTRLTEIPADGIVLSPRRVYLVNTEETMGSIKYVPIIRGRSSTGRLGLFIDITADLIDLGYVGQLTLQLHCVQRIRVYPGMLIGQITFWRTSGRRVFYTGKYNHTRSPVRSLSYLDN